MLNVIKIRLVRRLLILVVIFIFTLMLSDLPIYEGVVEAATPNETVKEYVKNYSTSNESGIENMVMKAYSRRGRKGGLSDRDARVGRLKGEATSLDGEPIRLCQ